jgi:hypothetical protein
LTRSIGEAQLVNAQATSPTQGLLFFAILTSTLMDSYRRSKERRNIMIDLTNYTHQRGIVILNSQEYRIANRSTTDVIVYRNCISDYADMMKFIINEFKNAEEHSEKDVMDTINALELNLKSIIGWNEDMKKSTERLEKIFY